MTVNIGSNRNIKKIFSNKDFVFILYISWTKIEFQIILRLVTLSPKPKHI